jgi:hypothetical protein
MIRSRNISRPGKHCKTRILSSGNIPGDSMAEIYRRFARISWNHVSGINILLWSTSYHAPPECKTKTKDSILHRHHFENLKVHGVKELLQMNEETAEERKFRIRDAHDLPSNPVVSKQTKARKYVVTVIVCTALIPNDRTCPTVSFQPSVVGVVHIFWIAHHVAPWVLRHSSKTSEELITLHSVITQTRFANI